MMLFPKKSITVIYRVLMVLAIVFCISENIHAANGEIEWSVLTGGDIYSSPAIGTDGTIYVGSLDGFLYALNPDGSGKWTFNIGAPIYSSPAIGTDGTIYIGSNAGQIHAVNADGTSKWNYTAGGAIYSSPAVSADGVIYAGALDGKLYAVNPDGSLQWSYTTGGAIYSSPSIGGYGTIYTGSLDGKIYAINPDGSLNWRYDTGGGIYSSPALDSDGTIYIGSRDYYLYAINSDGSLKWRYRAGNYLDSSPVIGGDGTIYIGCRNHQLYAVNADGTFQWSYTTGDDIRSSPAVGMSGKIYVGSLDNYLYAINSNGSLSWRYATGGDINRSSPAIGTDGTIYVGSLDYSIYAVENDDPLGDTDWPMFHHKLSHTGRSAGVPNDPPDKPSLISPANGTADLSLTPLLKTGTFVDPDSSDYHQYTRWQISTQSDFSTTVFHYTSASHLTSISITDLTLVEGQTYYWRVRYYDNHSTPSAWSDTFVFTTLTTENDKNGNGIPDSQENLTVDLDNDSIPDMDQLDIIKSQDMVTGNGQMGISRRYDATITAIESILPLDAEDISHYSRPSNMPLGLFGFRLTVATPGDTAEVTVYFSEAASEDATWYLYDTIRGWVDFSNYITFDSGRKFAVLELKDGSYGDADGIANGIIVDPGGFGIASWIEGFVTDSVTGKPITNATVNIEDAQFQTTLKGHFTGMIIPGNYTITVSAPGYATSQETGVSIEEAATITRNFQLVNEAYLSFDASAASSTVQTFAVTDTASPIFGASIQIPPGALADDAKITIGMVTDPPDFPNDMTGVGSVVEFGPDGLVFLTPVTISIPYTEQDLIDAGITDPSELSVVTYNANTSSWGSVDVSQINSGNHKVFCSVSHFSMYAIVKVDSETDTPAPAASSGGDGGGGGGGCFISNLE